MREHAATVLPLNAGQAERLSTGLSNSIVANVYGCLAVGVAQGSLASLAFWVLGLPSPVSMGTGHGVVLAHSNHWLGASVGAHRDYPGHRRTVVESADLVGLGNRGRRANRYLGPEVISERVKLHTWLVFFALLSGVEAFGVMGLFVGPVVLSVTLVVLETLRDTNLDYTAAR